MLILNWQAAVIVAIAFGIAIGVGNLAGIMAEAQQMIIAGPLCVIMDLVYRATRPVRRWFHPDGGGALFFIPVWMFGVLWVVLGIVRTVEGGR
jgi:hypothetical protein